MLPFESAEYEQRLERTQDAMAEEGLDVLLVSDPANLHYLTGYEGWSFYVHQIVVVTQERDQPIWIGRDMDAIGAKKTVWMDDENVRPYGDDYVQSTTSHPMEYIGEVLAEEGLDDGTIGAELDAYYFSAAAYEELKLALDDAVFVDTTYLVANVRAVKSDAEIEYMKAAGEIVTNATETAVATAGEGVRESDVAAEVYYELIKGTDEYGGDSPAMNPMLSSGESSNVPHFTWTDREIQSGDGITMEIAGSVRHYNSPLARTIYVDDPPSEALQAAEALTEGLTAVIDTIEPGITAQEAERAWSEAIEGSWLTENPPMSLKGGNARIGYAAGLGYPPDWGEHTTSFREGDDTVLEENMTFHIIPTARYEDFGIEMSETIRVTSSGAETFADVPRELLFA